MAHRDPPPVTANGAFDRDDSSGLVESLEQDFAALVTVLEHQLGSVSPSDRESRFQILKAKEAAQRGVSLSRQLIEQIQSRR